MNRSILLTIALLLGLAAELAQPELATACSAPEGSALARDVPANGVVLLEIHCNNGSSSCYGESLPAELPVIDLTTSEPVAGTIVHQEGTSGSILIAFKPDQPLVEGRSYEVMWQPPVPPTFDVDYVLEALAPTALTAEDVAVDIALSMVADPLYESVRCISQEKLGSCSSYDQISLTTKLFPTLSAALDMSTVPAGSEGQLAVTMAFWAEGEVETAQREVPAYRHQPIAGAQRFDAKHHAYCYRVEVTSLIDESFAIHEDCLEHGTMGELVELPTSDGVLTRRLGTCDDPPEGFLPQWCIGKREHCADVDNTLASCRDVAETCADVSMTPEEPPVEPDDDEDPVDDDEEPVDDKEEPIVDPDDGDEATKAPNEPGDEPEVTPAGPTSSGSSCAVREGASGRGALSALLTMIGFAVAVRRRARFDLLAE
jgi:hypothetical protein